MDRGHSLDPRAGLPALHASNVQSGAKHPSMGYRCRSCRKFFSVRSGTVMQHSNLGAQKWVIATYMLTTGLKGESSMKLHRDLASPRSRLGILPIRIRESWTGARVCLAVRWKLTRPTLAASGAHVECQTQGTGGQRARGGRQDGGDRDQGPQHQSGCCPASRVGEQGDCQ